MHVLCLNVTKYSLNNFEVIHYEPVRENPTIWVPTRSGINRAVQSQKKARSFNFRIKVEEGLYYLCGETKGADQLCSSYTADLRLWFLICKLLVFRGASSYNICFTVRCSVVVSNYCFNISSGSTYNISFTVR